MGLDASTQSLSVLVMEAHTKEVIYHESVVFDQHLPRYGTENGVLKSSNPQIAHSSPLMWVEALDIAFEKAAKAVDLQSVVCISGSGQQHGTVYLNSSAEQALKSLTPARSLAGSLRDIFSRPTSPVWMDSSTSEECHEIMEALGGEQATAEATGSIAFERFAGPQIRKFYKNEPGKYENTAFITLVSSFLASIISGRKAPIDHGDGAGMNLMNIKAKQWHREALEATAPNLGRRLPPLAPSDTVIGGVSPYFVKKYGINPNALSMVWSGDNPNSIIGLGLVDYGMTGISLGTSDTYFGFMEHCKIDPRGEGHVFGAPTGDYMTLIVFKNGSLAREKVKNRYGLSWDEFSEALRGTPPGNNGGIMLPYFQPEIVPRVLHPGVKRFDLDAGDPAGNCRAVVEAQMMSMRIHSQWMGQSPSCIYATGGASANEDILQIMADVLRCPVHRFEVSNSAALGAALRALHGHRKSAGMSPGWKETVRGCADPVAESRLDPNPDAEKVYDELIIKYRTCEEKMLRK